MKKEALNTILAKVDVITEKLRKKLEAQCEDCVANGDFGMGYKIDFDVNIINIGGHRLEYSVEDGFKFGGDWSYSIHEIMEFLVHMQSLLVDKDNILNNPKAQVELNIKLRYSELCDVVSMVVDPYLNIDHLDLTDTEIDAIVKEFMEWSPFGYMG